LLYFDTSFLTPLILQETTSEKVERFLSGLPAGELATSHLARVEFSSLLAREVRMGGLDRQAARAVDSQFETVMRESFVVFVPSVDDFDLAKEYLGDHATGLRAADALHLAVAKNHGGRAIYSLDKTLLRAGKKLGLPVTTGIRLTGYRE
jgi:predicted nucleic acid-binding protein